MLTTPTKEYGRQVIQVHPKAPHEVSPIFSCGLQVGSENSEVGEPMIRGQPPGWQQCEPHSDVGLINRDDGIECDTRPATTQPVNVRLLLLVFASIEHKVLRQMEPKLMIQIHVCDLSGLVPVERFSGCRCCRGFRRRLRGHLKATR